MKLDKLKKDLRVTSVIKDHKVKFEDISVLEFTGKEWITHQKGCSDEVAIWLINGKIQIVVSL
ncbi:hypothetical protein FE773_00840 [Caminibacter mediatlanticus TB-2]|uniref:Uncharacterized protein n=1 Tax=Caminibacter mediatlanticus TB-2 TaxID=391592 RepID=A0ABX5V6A8_9BACT|nr:hypothetical protein [Caminibacter mediatlanticus]QCT93773.1 hypothetical protein FE773_00840 [Caminibacter mediatlanticus TB-2]